MTTPDTGGDAAVGDDETPSDTDSSLGLARGRVELVSHDPAWREAYEREVRRLRAELDASVCGFEHVGSTAVPGVAAKPVVDMLLLVPALDATDGLAGELGALGYDERPSDGVRDRRFFARGPPARRTHYLSVTEAGSDCHRQQVTFRDALRSDPDLAAEYDRLKRELAAATPNDRATYTDSKSSFVRSVLADALAGEGGRDGSDSGGGDGNGAGAGTDGDERGREER